MKKTSAARPHLDHLRRQAKELLRALPTDDAAAQVLIRHLPAAKGMSPRAVRAAGFRLADAQSAIARMEGFGSWPELATHVNTLRAMEGEWRFDVLCVEGEYKAHTEYAAARLLIDADRFRMESTDADYEGVFNIDVAASPMQIDIHFSAGPEAGSVCRGIFSLDGETLQCCLPLGTGARPQAFASLPGSGHVFEQLRRVDASRPSAGPAGRAATPALATAPFEVRPSAQYALLAGRWQACSAMRDGQAMSASMLARFERTCEGTHTLAQLHRQVMVDADFSIDDSQSPIHIDYRNANGSIQLGILAWDDEEFTVCTAPAGAPRPQAFESPKGSGITLSRWRRRA